MIRVVCLTLIAALGFGSAAFADASALVQLAIAQQRAIHPTVPAYGTVAPDPDYLATVAIPRDSIISAVSVRAGQFVSAGYPIVTIWTAPGALATYQQARSALAFAQKDLAHTRELYAEQLATKSQLAAAEKAVADAQAQFQSQTKVGTNKSSEVIRASAPGIVTGLNASPGDRVQANTVVASVATRDRLIVNLGLEPSDALEVTQSAKVRLHSPQRKEIGFAGQIQSVDAMMDAKSRLVNAVVTIPQNVANRLVLGMALEGTVELPAITGIVVPHNALMTDGKGTYVFVVKKNIARRHNVRIEFETDTGALIAQGVAAGDRVVVAGNAGLEDGTHVRVH